ncbi:hypothetical protein CHL76_01125 [Marinococcus halophilus]|uniref:Uncharacterized protein n=1 Tax=Marinococcus halophilus TaxID=1371 RepID=A0A510Y2Y9_MARHA|nr:hypothetical protein [Marinococcus halophilus]OZT81727.1 hypothetical protein CHL76_01125 [Marinococcus halophilus]GEK57682.1 hypothetical protein MHA01_05870 [Marinococcus halophilus]
MSQVHYFPRYSQKENMVTNNTLLLFNRLYNYSADTFNQFLNNLIEKEDHEIDTRLAFEQQVKAKESVPDGVIHQQSFKIIIETKLYGQEHIQQLIKHHNSFNNEDQQLLLWVNKSPIDEAYKAKIIKELTAINEQQENKIMFIPVTFKEICDKTAEVVQNQYFGLGEVVEDYAAFCNEAGLIDNSHTKMRVVLASKSLEQNIEHGVYYAPSSRGYQQHKYLGLYGNKAVRGIGQITNSADIEYNEESDEFSVIATQIGNITEKQKNTIKQVIQEAKEEQGFLIAKGHRFFFVDKFEKTEYKKPTPGGLMGQRYFDLADVPGFTSILSTKEIAELLNHREWETKT